LANTSVKVHLVVDHLARGLELLLMLVLGGIEQLSDDPACGSMISSETAAIPLIVSTTSVA
jgi:hypothetical protein